MRPRPLMRLSDDTQRLVARSSHRQPGCAVLTIPRCPMPSAPGLRAKRTVVEGSGGRLIPFGRSRLTHSDAVTARCCCGVHPFAGGTPSLGFYPLSNRPPLLPFHHRLQDLALRLYPHIVPGNHHLLWSLSYRCRTFFHSPQDLSADTSFEVWPRRWGPMLPQVTPFLAPHVVLCLSNRSRASNYCQVGVTPYIDRLAGNVTRCLHIRMISYTHTLMTRVWNLSCFLLGGS